MLNVRQGEITPLKIVMCSIDSDSGQGLWIRLLAQFMAIIMFRNLMYFHLHVYRLLLWFLGRAKICNEISSGSQWRISISSHTWMSRCSGTFPFVITISYHSYSPSKLVPTNRDANTRLDSLPDSLIPQSPALVQIALSSVKVRLAVSVDDCFCGSWNETLLKLCTIFYFSEGACVSFLVRLLTVACVTSLQAPYCCWITKGLSGWKRILKFVNKMIVISKVVTILSFQINHKTR
jgi:hypothetical protein